MTRQKRLRRKKQRSKLKRNIFFALAFIFATFSILTIVNLGQALHDLPDLNNKQIGKLAQTSKIYDYKGKLITTLHAEQNRVVVPLFKIPRVTQLAAIAIEDERFYHHHGVDFLAILRALYEDIKSGKIVEGGSTLTQQYVKNAFIKPQKTINRKIKEAFLAYEIEKRYSKRKILEMYLNTVYFGHGNYGVETAAEAFFGKKAKQLNLAESALLAGLIKSPGYFSPYVNTKLTKIRRNIVIDKMVQLKFINRKQASVAKATPIKIQPLKYSSTYPAPYFIEYIKQQIMADKRFGSTEQERANALYKGGLKIYTTIDMTMQKFADEAANNTLNYAGDPTAALVAVEPATGFIKAMVGGKNFFDPKNKQAKFNLAAQAQRQTGSAFKVFVLASAIDQGMTPYKTYDSSPTTLYWEGAPWRVDNYTEGKGYGRMSIMEGTVYSVNALYARLMMDVGPENVVRIAHKMGITSQLDPYPAIALGGLRKGVSPLEMASAMATLANNGSYHKPMGITKITDSEENIIVENKPVGKPAIDNKVAAVVTSVLQNVIYRGTGRAANIFRPAAGKTGTAEHYQDAWFIGYTPDLAAAVWVGYPDRLVQMNSVHGINITGGSFPAQIWQSFMYNSLKNTPPKYFKETPYYERWKLVKICKDSWKLATPNCPPKSVVDKYYSRENAPSEYCDVHATGIQVPNVVGMFQSDAVQALNENGFVVNKKYSDSEAEAGKVIGQNPSPGTKAQKGKTVTIYISTGQTQTPETTVPGVVGTSEGTAVKTLQSNGYRAYRVYENAGPSYKGKVVRQDPPEGTDASKGSTVTIWIGS